MCHALSDPALSEIHPNLGTSPLREAGVRYSWMNAPATDLDGNPRLTDHFGKPFATAALPDLGCYECQDRITRGTTVLVQ